MTWQRKKMTSIRSVLLFIMCIILPSTTHLCDGHGVRTSDDPLESLLRRVSALENSDAKQQEINTKLQTEFDLEKTTNAELRNELIQLKRANTKLYLALDTQGKLIAELKESLAKRDADHLEMVETPNNVLLEQKNRAVKGQELPPKYFQRDTTRNDGIETVPSKRSSRKVAVRSPSRIRQVETEVPVAFSAGLSHVVSNIGKDQNIVFDHVDINTGNGYNPHHGIFVAPVSGTYVLHTTIYAGNEFGRLHVFCHFVVNGIRRSGLYVESGSTASDTGSQMLITRLNKGDDVVVQVYTPVAHLNGNAHTLSTFSGFLLAQDVSSSTTVVG